MKVLRTIVATAVIVFAMSTVAVAGVHHVTKQSGQVSGSQAQMAQPTYTVTLTAAQLARLMNDDQSDSHVGEAQSTKTHARRVHREHAAAQHGVHEAEAQHVERIRSSAQSSSGGQAGSQHSEPSHQTHAAGSGHDGGHGAD